MIDISNYKSINECSVSRSELIEIDDKNYKENFPWLFY